MAELDTILIHRIVEGPFHSWDVEDTDGEYEGDFYFCMALVEHDGEMSIEEVRFDLFPDFSEVKYWLEKNKGPYQLEAEAF